jgi:hypothetical protein
VEKHNCNFSRCEIQELASLLKLSGNIPVIRVLQVGRNISSKMSEYREGRSRNVPFCLKKREVSSIFFIRSLLMARPEFPSTPIVAVSKKDVSPVEKNPFVQPALEAMEMEQPPEIELGNCTVTSVVRFRKRVKGNEWHYESWENLITYVRTHRERTFLTYTTLPLEEPVFHLTQLVAMLYTN